MLVKLFFTFLILNLVQNVLTNEFYEYTEELRFVKGEKTTHTQPLDQLICLDGPDGEKLCKDHCPQEIICTNPNKGKTITSFVCDADFPKTIAFKNYDLSCDESNNNEAFKVGTCHIEITLKKVVEKPKDSGKGDGEEESWFKRNMGYVIGGSIGVVLLVVVGAAGYTQLRKRRS